MPTIKAKAIFRAYVRVIKLLLALAHQIPQFHQQLKANKLKLVETVKKVRNSIGLKRTLLFFNISTFTFRQWSIDTFTSCFHSITAACNKIFPNQLSRPEVVKLKGMLLDEKFHFWPISSIAHYALKNNILPLSINTWYKYAAKLGITRPKALPRTKKRAESVRAKKPNQLWHADITEFVTDDRVKHYIYLVADNFSRKILAFLVEDKISVAFRKTTIMEAFKHLQDKIDLTLLTDGGSENNFSSLNTAPHTLTHIKSLTDVHYSNSLIEAHNKILKYNYLYKMSIGDSTQIKKIIEWIVEDYNNRPHVSLDGLSPNEKYQNQLPDRDSRAINIQKATIERKEYNKNNRCKTC